MPAAPSIPPAEAANNISGQYRKIHSGQIMKGLQKFDVRVPARITSSKNTRMKETFYVGHGRTPVYSLTEAGIERRALVKSRLSNPQRRVGCFRRRNRRGFLAGRLREIGNVQIFAIFLVNFRVVIVELKVLIAADRLQRFREHEACASTPEALGPSEADPAPPTL
jgi:hypothetical protein